MRNVKIACLTIFVLVSVFAIPLSSWAKDGDCLKGNCENGEGTFRYRNGLTYEGDWLKGFEHGHGHLAMPSGSVYIGDFEYGQPHGQGTFKRANGTNYEGAWVDGLAEGFGIEISPEGSSYEGNWRSGLRNGYGVSTKGGGVDKDGYWVDGEFIGQDKKYNAN